VHTVCALHESEQTQLGVDKALCGGPCAHNDAQELAIAVRKEGRKLYTGAVPLRNSRGPYYTHVSLVCYGYSFPFTFSQPEYPSKISPARSVIKTRKNTGGSIEKRSEPQGGLVSRIEYEGGLGGRLGPLRVHLVSLVCLG
jgi:hypothetical protein